MNSTNRRQKKISFVIPIYNEEENITELIKQLNRFISKNNEYAFEVIFVENGSVDNSMSLLQNAATKEKRFKIIQLVKNEGCDGGIYAGLQQVTGDACVIMMADLQEPLSIVHTFITKWVQGYEIVYGVVKKRTAGFIRDTSSKIYYKILNLATNNAFPENVSDFRLIDKKVVDVLKSLPEQNKYLRGLIIWTGYKHIGVEFDRTQRFAGESKADFITVLNVAKNGIFSFSYLPLRIVSYLGIFITIISFVLIIIYFILFLIWGRVTPGVTTIILLILFLFGVLFFILGVISEYIARIYEEAKKRPEYLIRKKINL